MDALFKRLLSHAEAKRTAAYADAAAKVMAQHCDARIAEKDAEIGRLRTALSAIARTTFSGSEMGDEYQRGNREAHETCRRMARAVLTDGQSTPEGK